MTDAWTERVERGAREYFNGKKSQEVKTGRLRASGVGSLIDRSAPEADVYASPTELLVMPLTGPMRPRLPSLTLSSRERPGSATAASAH